MLLVPRRGRGQARPLRRSGAVDDGASGVLVPLRDVAALTVAIGGLLADPERARRMGEAGRRIARVRFDERQVFAKVLATYERLLTARNTATERAWRVGPRGGRRRSRSTAPLGRC